MTKRAKISVIIKKPVAIYKAKLWATKGYKAFETFKVKVFRGSTLAFTMGFDLCKVQVAQLFSKVDVSCYNPKENEMKLKKMVQILALLLGPCSR